MIHSWRDIEDKVKGLRTMSLDDIAGEILDLEAALEECGGKLSDANDRIAELEEPSD